MTLSRLPVGGCVLLLLTSACSKPGPSAPPPGSSSASSQASPSAPPPLPGPSKEDVLSSAFKGGQPEGFVLKSLVTENTPDPARPGAFSVAFKMELEASEDLCRLLDNKAAFSKYAVTPSRTDQRVAFAEVITPKGSILPIHGKISAERIVDKWMCRVLEADKSESAAVRNAGTKFSSLAGIIPGELIPIPSERATAFFNAIPSN